MHVSSFLFSLIIFIMGLGLLIGWELRDEVGHLHHVWGFIAGGLMGTEMKGILFAIYLVLYLLTLLVHYVMFTFMFVHS